MPLYPGPGLFPSPTLFPGGAPEVLPGVNVFPGYSPQTMFGGMLIIPAEHQERLAKMFSVSVPWLMGEDYGTLDPSTLVDAVLTLHKQSRTLIELQMATIDLLRDVQEGRQAVDLPNLRHVAVNQFRRWDASREGAVSMIIGEPAGSVA